MVDSKENYKFDLGVKGLIRTVFNTFSEVRDKHFEKFLLV